MQEFNYDREWMAALDEMIRKIRNRDAQLYKIKSGKLAVPVSSH
jgi:hypothetical protein